jgi:hypothetical protein
MGERIMPYMEVCYSGYDKLVHIPSNIHSVTLCGKIGLDYHVTGSQGVFHTIDECCSRCWELSVGKKEETKMEIKPKCRIKCILSCNLNCEYCINKSEEYRKKWKYIEVSVADDLDQISFKKYRSIVISGGEPLLFGDNNWELQGLLSRIRGKSLINTPIYLQTNGTLLTKEFVKNVDNYIDGIGISIHDWVTFLRLKTRFIDISKIKPIKLYIQDNTDNRRKYGAYELCHNFSVRWWEDGKFDENEEIFVINYKWLGE